ncbi:hypothetical protein GCM10018780_88460 [Streptomyces lanatus]|nr:hypothetical protein GCM10018780_88460 [Streptomyces lanatus]
MEADPWAGRGNGPSAGRFGAGQLDDDDIAAVLSDADPADSVCGRAHWQRRQVHPNGRRQGRDRTSHDTVD